MGSMGWAQCFWCPRWTYNRHMQVLLCDTCYGNHLDLVNDGVPPHPNAIDHKAKALEIILPRLGGGAPCCQFPGEPLAAGGGLITSPAPPQAATAAAHCPGGTAAVG